jgi:DNA polymerase III sliding clamp (beta) subunit (PCNA family)
MNILSALRFVSGAVSRNGIVASLQHLLIKDGRVSAYDGLLAMSCPIEIGLHVKPDADELVRAIKACGTSDVLTMHMTAAGKLSIKSGGFRAFVPCLPDEADMQMPLPSGDAVELTPDFYAAVKIMAPFMSDQSDVHRAWANGIRVAGDSIFATKDNVIVIQHWTGVTLPREVIIPYDAIKELLRVGEAPVGCLVDNASITFFFTGQRWLRTQLIAENWPEIADKMLATTAQTLPVPEGLFAAVEKIKAFMNKQLKRVYFFKDRLATSNEASDGASVDVVLPEGPIFQVPYLQLLDGVATDIDFSTWPRPCTFRGNKIRGLIVGMNQ